jgi:hypothetical protein
MRKAFIRALLSVLLLPVSASAETDGSFILNSFPRCKGKAVFSPYSAGATGAILEAEQRAAWYARLRPILGAPCVLPADYGAVTFCDKGRDPRHNGQTGALWRDCLARRGRRQDGAKTRRMARRSSRGGLRASPADCAGSRAGGSLNEDRLGEGRLGQMYLNGQGVPQDYAQAHMWFRKGAEQGDSLSQDSLGYLYETGKGVPQDTSGSPLRFKAVRSLANTRHPSSVLPSRKRRFALSHTPTSPPRPSGPHPPSAEREAPRSLASARLAPSGRFALGLAPNRQRARHAPPAPIRPQPSAKPPEASPAPASRRPVHSALGHAPARQKPSPAPAIRRPVHLASRKRGSAMGVSRSAFIPSFKTSVNAGVVSNS